MSDERTEEVTLEITAEMKHRLEETCRKLNLTPNDIFEIGFSALFPLANKLGRRVR